MMKLLAPNGKPSKLTPEQYRLVRTPAFKAWFGDWENSPETASKVVDENGEPLICYHGSNKKFYVFDPSKEGLNKKTIRMGGNAIYFSNKERVARMFTDNYGEGYVYPCFLLFKNPIFLDAEGGEISYLNQELKKIPNTKDIIVKNTIDVLDMYKGQYQKDYISDIYITSNPNNIKLADKLFKPIWTESGMSKLKTIGKINTTFDSNNPDIRYKDGGEVSMFLDKVREDFYNDGNPLKLKIGATKIEIGLEELENGNESIFINDILTEKEHQGKGEASKVLKEIINYADENNIDISLRTSAGGHYGSKGLSQDELTKWYEKYGFKLSPYGSVYGKDDSFMIREPIEKIYRKSNKYKNGGDIEEKLYRNTSIDWLNDFLKKGIAYPYLNKKRFISFSKEEDSGGADNFGETNIEFNAKELYKQGAIEIEYNVDFFEQNPEICKYVTGYKGEDDYYQQKGYEGKEDFEENGQDDFDTLMWETVIEDYENEAEVVIKKLKYKDGLILSVNGEKFENYKFNEVGRIENLFLQNGFTEDELQRILEENENYFKQIEFYDNETLIIYRTIALPKKLVDKFIKLDKKAIGDGIGEYWTLDKEFGRSVWGGGHYEGEETFDVTCVGHLKIKDIDWEMMKYAFNDDPYNFGSESEIRGVNGGNYIKIVGCQDKYKNGGDIEEPTEFWGESAAGVLLICKKTNRVLLFHRSEDVYEPETWGIISGKIDYDENPKDAVLRELVEETKFSEKEVKSIVLKPSYVYKKGSFTFYNYLGFVDSEFTPTLNWENTDYKWCDIGDYPQPLHFGVSLLLKNIDLKKELYKKTIKKRLLAGKPSNLTPEQYALVRTPAFKEWFGDWENSPETASKVIDSNGEPLVVYHGTIKDFSIFSFDKLGSGIKANLGYLGIYFTDDKTLATDFTRIKWTNPNSKFKKGSKVYEVFLKIKNPKYMTIDGFILMDNKNRSEESIKNVRKDLLKKGYDGIIVEKAQLYWQSKMREFDGKQYIILQNNKNIKLADGTNTTFDGKNPDIRYKNGGTLYHGGYDIGDDLILRSGYYGGRKTGVDSGAIFFTPSLKYAKQYVKDKNGLYKYELNSADKIFDGLNKSHYLKLKKGFLKDWQDDYSSKEDAISDYLNSVKSIKSSISYGAIDWATGSQFIDQINKAGFDGIKFLERPAENIELNKDGGYDLTGEPVYSYALFKDEVKVDRYKKGGKLELYHGGQKVFKKFKTNLVDRIDYGWGLYFSDSEEVAKYYARRPFDRPLIFKTIWDSDLSLDEKGNVLSCIRKNLLDIQKSKKELNEKFYPLLDKIEQIIKNKGVVYKVDVEKGRWLDWDKKVPEYIRLMFTDIKPEFFESGEDLYNYLSRKEQSEKKASIILLNKGIEGIRYKISNMNNTNMKGYNYVIFDDDYIKVKEVFRYNNGGEFKDVVCSSCGWGWNKHESEEDVYVCHKCGTDNNPAHEVSDSLSSQEVEDKLGRKLDWWNDDIVYLSGIKYKKVYLRPEYKKVIE